VPLLLDVDFSTMNRKLYFGETIKQLVINQLRQDVYLLARHKIIDYSLVVGIHRIREEDEENMLGLSSLIYDSIFATGVCTVLSHAEIYFLGLIDILTPYDAQKKSSPQCKDYNIHT